MPDLTRFLLACGLLIPVLYLGIDLAAAHFFYPGYDLGAQQVSELSALGAPSRPFWIAMAVPSAALTLAFGIGVWRASQRPALRIAALAILLFAAIGLPWVLFAPMHMRATAFETTDVLHIAFACLAVLLMLGFIAAGATALGPIFRLYSAITVLATLAAGAVVSTRIPDIAAGRPTPWMGLVERISVYGPLLWLAVLALALLVSARRGRAAGENRKMNR